MYLTKKCAISGKAIGDDENFVSFPFFDAYPGDPEFICCEGLALRSKFEEWDLKDRVIKKVRDFWIHEYHDAEYFSILAENENFLITKSEVTDYVRLFFLKHAFYAWFTENAWKRFKDLATVEIGSIDISEKEIFSWDVNSTNDHVLLQITGERKDAIIIPIAEWQNFQELISAIK